MMEAKDTVMNDRKRAELYRIKFDEFLCRQENLVFLLDHKTFECEYEIATSLIEAQAEISFGAGQVDGYRTGLAEGIDKGGYVGCKAGIREVVEWVESHEKSTCMDCSCAYAFRGDEWQAKLKEWRIE